MKFDKEKLDKLLSEQRTNENVTELLELNKRLVRKAMQKLYVENNDDAYSYGMEALYKAILTFDISGKIQFSTYAYRCIYNLIGSYVIRKSKTIKESTPVLSFSQPTSADSDLTLGDSISSDYEMERMIVGEMSVKPIWYAFFAELNNTKSTMAKDVLLIWYDSNFKMSNKDIALEANCSVAYANRILHQFRAKLKRRLQK